VGGGHGPGRHAGGEGGQPSRAERSDGVAGHRPPARVLAL
jgi:hypothetical protein